MEILPETAAVLRRLGESTDVDLVAAVAGASERVVAEVPSCLGFSYCLAAEDLTFTVVATSSDAAVLDGAQYVDDGPCLEAAREESVVELPDVLDEVRWQRFAQTAAARGVRSSLSLPVLEDGELVGTVNFYAAEPGAFVGHEVRLAEIVGASAGVAITNADLPFRSRDHAVASPARLEDLVVVERAIGALAQSRHVDIEQARELLHDAARRAGVEDADLARSMLRP